MEPHPVKTAIEGWRGTERKLWCHLWRYKWKAHTRSATLWRNVATFWSNKKWMVTLAQQNQRHEFSCPPNLSSSTRAAMARRWSLKCDQHERVSLSGILSTFVYNAVVTPTGASNSCLSIMVLFWNLFVCNMFMSTYWSPIFLFIFFQTSSWVYNESMEKMIQCC